MKRRNDNRRAALAWFPTPLAGAWPHTLRWARRPPPDIDPEAEVIRELVADSGVDGYTGGKPVEFEHRGLTIRVKVEHDVDIDPKDDTGIKYAHGKNDANGTFRYRWRQRAHVHAVAVRARHGNRPDWRAYEHMDLSSFFSDRIKDARKAGMARHAAWEWAKASALTEYELLEKFNRDDWWYVWIKVTVEDDCGCELGEASVGGVAFNTDDKGATAYIRSTVEELVHEALRDAKRDKLTMDLFDTFQHGAGI